jgi:hypothetical protein
MRIARVFPRRTRATPDDALAFNGPPGLFAPDVDAVHISVTFSWDLPASRALALEWERVAPVTVGGPAIGSPSAEFTPGLYLKRGYVITSRGCPNRCWFCSVWRREGRAVRELPIVEGWNVLDDNLLACSYRHICNVFDMLWGQKRRVEFTGGLEAARFEAWTAEALRSINPKQFFFAFDTPEDWAPLARAVKLCWRAGFTKASHVVRCYVLCGWPKDTIAAAEERMRRVLSIGVMPMAMLWRDNAGRVDHAWRTFQRRWARPMIVGTELREALIG